MKTLFGEREKKISRAPVENSSTSITQIARQLFAMSQKKTEAIWSVHFATSATRAPSRTNTRSRASSRRGLCAR